MFSSAPLRHCELLRSDPGATKKNWIASSQELLAMTRKRPGSHRTRFTRGPLPVIASSCEAIQKAKNKRWYALMAFVSPCSSQGALEAKP
jgi:hypothetical protein